ncbi:hypothetical protein K461DRAFT_7850 [Myriangium duriaei CBS 260.36]|uniref:AAA+ ATPase domain-containing protein n=1 Tax=Myriangium duriaei CBS 260.36 TaxID=1168546 RepID=A0A9P4J7T9_9PEZI|nr:hypothetical protein K461DRAFT_7850 [Myriangium duriaei CBS 260.36]
MAVSLALPAMTDASKSTLHSFFGVKSGDQQPSHNAIHRHQEPSRRTHGTKVSRTSATSHEQDTTVGSEGGTRNEAGDRLSDGNNGTMAERNKSSTTIAASEERREASGMAAWPIAFKQQGPERKRRKVHHDEGSIESKTAEHGVAIAATAATATDTSVDTPATVNHHDEDLVMPTSTGGTTMPARKDNSEAAGSRTPPKKMLKIGASGKLGSPTTDRPSRALEQAKPKKRGRPKRSLIVVCCYKKEGDLARTNALVQRIDDILCGKERFTKVKEPVKKETSTKQVQLQSSKSTHPFFTGKLNKTTTSQTLSENKDNNITVSSSSPERKSFASTPGKIRLQVQQMKQSRVKAPVFGEQPQSVTRSVNAKGEAWPAPGTLHVRGLEIGSRMSAKAQQMPLRKKKLASSSNVDNTTGFNHLSSINGFDIDEKNRLRSDGFSDPHPRLRVPNRSLLTGPEILQRIRPQLSSEHTSHAAISRLTKTLPKYLTSYDEGRGEPLPWSHKYAPPEASAVLQAGHEATVLRDWMKMLAVSAVGGSLLTVPKSSAESKPRKKRRRKAAELEDFIVSSGDEKDQLGSLSGLEELGSQESIKEKNRSLVRSAQDGVTGEMQKLANTVVISGPHGCGKTAMVLAVAKELNYQVFEINAGSRRSGRDVLERIGDVIGNHIVSHNKPDTGNTSADEDSKRVSEAFQKDLESGRQGTMGAFFKAAPAKRKGPPKAIKKQPNADLIAKVIGSEPSRHQKQSIILLEEVDILFEEDKSFWTTVLTLIASSRRPVVMTCTDESPLPWDELTLHAELRLAPPPPEIAIDYLLLLAAQEGHLLERKSVDSLYQQKRNDLRASIVELQFWCQMGIGDPRGGLSWIFQRWPPGKGTDAGGNAQRVVSEGTYHSSMGSLPSEREDIFGDQRDEELLSEAWVSWALDPRDDAHVNWVPSLGTPVDHNSLDPQSRLQALRQVESLTSTLSALDIQCRLDTPSSMGPRSRFALLGSSLSHLLDPTQPSLTPRSKTSYTDYPTLIQADDFYDPTNLTHRLVTSTCAILPSALRITSPNLAEHLHNLTLSAAPYSHLHPIPASDLYAALEPLADPASSSQHQSGTYTSILSPLPLLTTEIAPYVRAIAAHDFAREEQRRELYDALHGEEGKGKMRRTRAARGAMEGKGRGGVRRERWWEAEIDVSGTAGAEMTAAGERMRMEMEEEKTRIEADERAGDVEMSQE